MQNILVARDHLVESSLDSLPFLIVSKVVVLDIANEGFSRGLILTIKSYHYDIIFDNGADTEFGVESPSTRNTMSRIDEVVHST